MSDTPRQPKAYSVGFSARHEPVRLGERKELWRALQFLNDLERVRLLTLCCDLATRGRPFVTPDTTGEINECYNDLALLVVMHGASWEAVTKKAIEFARGAETCR